VEQKRENKKNTPVIKAVCRCTDNHIADMENDKDETDIGQNAQYDIDRFGPRELVRHKVEQKRENKNNIPKCTDTREDHERKQAKDNDQHPITITRRHQLRRLCKSG
jgi:hypothetical protein